MHGPVGSLLMWLEGLLGIGWIVMMGFGQGKGTSQYRTAIFFLLFHFVFTSIPLSWASYKFSKKKHPHKAFGWGYMWAFMFGIAVDINNLLETILYLPRADHLWYGMIILSSVALGLSTFSWLWYMTLLRKHGSKMWNGKWTISFRPTAYKERKMNSDYTKRGGGDDEFY